MKIINKVLRLKKRPIGFPDEDTWELSEEILPSLNEGEILIENNYISLDPAMRGWMNETRSYIEPVKIGDVMRAGSIGKVIESNNPKFSEGDVVSGGSGVQQYSINDGVGFFKIYPGKLDLPVFIGTLGLPRMPAYFGILEVGKITEGETVLVSAAAYDQPSRQRTSTPAECSKDAVGTGFKEKCDYVVNELGFDGCIDYKNESVKRGIKKECPNGIDVYFDNVGGDILDSALIFINKYARIVVCGAISQYNKTSAKGPDNYLSLLFNRGTMTGMVVFDYVKKYPIAVEEMSNWILEGKLKSKEDIYDGIENFYEIFKKLFNGDKKGKLILKVN